MHMPPVPAWQLGYVAFALAPASAAQSRSPDRRRIPTPSSARRPRRAQHAMVVSIHHDASDAGVEILKQGGNAVDAAVAVGFALAVVYPAAGNIGGGGFMLIRDHSTAKPTSSTTARKPPPPPPPTCTSTPQGNVIPGLSITGYKASGVPGTVAGLTYAQKHFGKLTLAQDMAPAIHLATDGFVLSADEARSLAQPTTSPASPSPPTSSSATATSTRQATPSSSPLLAATLTPHRRKTPPTSTKAPWPSRSPPSSRPAEASSPPPTSPPTRSKTANPLTGSYRGYDSSPRRRPPPAASSCSRSSTSSPATTCRKLGPDRSAAQVHLITEAFRRAYMDRADYLGDPDFISMPIKQMADPELRRRLAHLHRPHQAHALSNDLVRPAGFLPPPPAAAARTRVHRRPPTSPSSTPRATPSPAPTPSTAASAPASPSPASASCSTTRWTTSPPSSASPTCFGLIQSSANAIAPGKRPLSAMTPTIVITEPHRPACVQTRQASASSSAPPAAPPSSPPSPTTSSASSTTASTSSRPPTPPASTTSTCPTASSSRRPSPLDVVDQLKATGYTINRDNEADEHNPGIWGDSELIYIDPKTHDPPRRPRPAPPLRQSRRLLTILFVIPEGNLLVLFTLACHSERSEQSPHFARTIDNCAQSTKSSLRSVP